MKDLLLKRGDKIIATVVGDTLVKKVRSSMHMLRVPAAWAIDKDIYDNAREYFHSILIYDTENLVQYRCSKELFEEKRFLLDRGHGEQYALTLGYWQQNKV